MQNILSSGLLSKNFKIKIYRTIVLTVVLYGCETWSLTLREEHRLRVLRRIFWSKSEEATGEWRKLHNEELYDSVSLTQYCAGDKIEKNEMGGHVARMRKGETYTGYCWGHVRIRDHLEN
jgi:hypothetical protein